MTDWKKRANDHMGELALLRAEVGELRSLLADCIRYVRPPENGHNCCRYCDGQRYDGNRGWEHDQHCHWVYMRDETTKLVRKAETVLGSGG